MKSSTQATGISVALTLEPFDEKRYDIAPGMSCTINMKVESPQHDTVTAVPLTAVFSRDNREWVWIVGTGRRVKAQPVKLGQLFGSDMVMIDDGLKAGDEVVTAGVYQIVEGEEVKLLP